MRESKDISILHGDATVPIEIVYIKLNFRINRGSIDD